MRDKERERAEHHAVSPDTGGESAEALARHIGDAADVSADILARFLEALPGAVFIKDEQGHPLYLNRFMRESLGLPDDWRQHSTESLFPGDVGERMRADDREAMARGYLAREETIRAADGTPHQYYTQKFVLPGTSECFLGGIALDITGRKQIEEALRKGERKYRQLFENMTAAFSLHEMIYDATGRAVDYRYLEGNPAFERLTGMTAASLVGKTVRETFGDIEPHWLEVFSKVAQTGEPVVYQDYVPLLDRYFDTCAFSPDKGYFALVFTDITERKRAEEALKRSETTLRTILDASPLAIACADEQGRVEFWNQRSESMFGYSPGEIATVEQWYEKAYPDPVYRETCKKAWEQALAFARQRHTATDSIECVVTCKDGSRRDMEIFGTFADDRLLAIFRDVTEQHRAAEERAKLEAQMQQAQKLESLGVLAGGIAHDFNNLLMSILGFADLLLLDLPGASPSRKSVESISNAARRAADLCSQMLAYSGRGRLEVRRFDLTLVIREMSRMLEVSLSKRAILQYDFAQGLPAVEGDPTQIRQIIMNLVTNASEALADREGLITVRTHARVCDRKTLDGFYLGEGLREGPYVCLQVTDTGCGMDRDTVAKMFDPFFTTKFTGRGLGLAAVLGIIRGHGGALSVVSEPAKGTSFTVCLPAAAPQPPPPSPEMTALDWNASGKVLLVDDEDAVREVGALILKRLGFEVSSACDGVEALEYFEQHGQDFCCVILDLTMPRMDGDECFRRLRQQRADLPVVLCSGFGEQEFAERFANEPRLGFVQKPYQIRTMADAIRRVLAGQGDPA